MKVTYNWLKDYVDFALSPQALADGLTSVGLEVESLTPLSKGLEDLLVAEVRKCEPHPSADRLTLCTVFDGTQDLSVVCGAPNVRAGLKVALAPVGARLPGDNEIKKTKIRGVESLGMLCSERELELSETHAGILELPEGAVPGTKLVDELGLRDWVLEIGVTPNRADCLGVVGVAREVAALVGARLKLPDVHARGAGFPVADHAKVRIEAPARCSRYIARVIHDVKIGPSPPWMVRRLAAVGIRSISNIVDVTNYVMMELGQPLHAFDLKLVAGSEINVRLAREGEAIQTLDGETRKLIPQDLVIADAQRALALAGVMGGEGSGVSAATTSLLLESAIFESTGIRRTARRLGLHTDSSHRFERGADPGIVDLASKRAADLILQTAGGTLCTGALDVSVPGESMKRTVLLDVSKANALLGTNLTRAQAADLLMPLGMTSVPVGQTALNVEVPTWRGDVTRSVDVAEELARRVGYNSIPETVPTKPLLVERENLDFSFELRAKEVLCELGLTESVSLAFADPRDAERIRDVTTLVPLANPMSEEQSALVPSLVPGLLRAVAHNMRHGEKDVLLFELRRVFSGSVKDVQERRSLAALFCGSRHPHTWASKAVALDFFDAKGVVESFFRHLGITNFTLEQDTSPRFIAGARVAFFSKDTRLGSLGEIDPEVLVAFDIDGARVFAVEIDFDALAVISAQEVKFSELPRFPSVVRDVALTVDVSTPAGEILQCAHNAGIKELVHVDLFDVYEGAQVGVGKKSVGLTITYRDRARTLTDEAVVAMHDTLVKRLQERFSATLRA